MDTVFYFAGLDQQITLQWGHSLSAMDTVLSGTKGDIAEMLQWGHSLSAMDTRNPQTPNEKRVFSRGRLLSDSCTQRQSLPHSVGFQ